MCVTDTVVILTADGLHAVSDSSFMFGNIFL